MQILYLSNRPQVMRDTWEHVRHLMGWVDRAVIVAPAASHAGFSWADGDPAVRLVADEEITGRTSSELRGLDHVRRNVALRRALVGADPAVDDVFLLSDDDYRPMREVPESFFVTDEGDVGYFSYELAEWPGTESDFDRAQHATHDALSYLGYPHLAYGAHMPQVMRRDLWAEAFDIFGTVSTDDLVDEWSLYFNVAAALHPERFAAPRPFETMCWPQYGAEWSWWVRPERWTFENFYEDLYEPGHLFEGMPTAWAGDRHPQVTYEKIRRWTDFARAAKRLDFPPDVYNPWTKQSPWRRAAFGMLRPARKAYHYISSRSDGDR